MRKIPSALRAKLEADPFYQRCCLTGIKKSAWAKIEWHHNLIFAGRQVNEEWCILPLEESFHKRAHEPWIKECLDRIMLNRATDDQLRQYSKAIDLIKRRDQLNEKHEDKENSTIL